MAGAEHELEAWLAQIEGPTAPLIQHASRGFLAIAQTRWNLAVFELQQALPNHEILGGSRAQRDLLLEAFAFAQGRGAPLDHKFGRRASSS